MAMAFSVRNRLPIIYKQTILFIVAGLAIIGDQLSKGYIEANLSLEESWWPIPSLLFFRFTHVANTGGAFGIFPLQPSVFLFIVTAATIIILYKNNAVPLSQWDKRVAPGLILGGALGNVVSVWVTSLTSLTLSYGRYSMWLISVSSLVCLSMVGFCCARTTLPLKWRNDQKRLHRGFLFI